MGYAIAKKLGIACVSQRRVSQGDAVMFDIDETLIHRDGTPIHEMCALFNFCKHLGYRMILITARPDFAVTHYYTRMQLITHNIIPNEVYFSSPEEKSATKQQTGLHFVLSVGDLYTDLGNSEYFIKLPDTKDRRVYSNIRVAGK